ncbi:SdpI family protein [Anaerofustis stercorihominis]|uniref:DUF1648 domain-containing protein n=1 Tax=Anaerofustis stercorihominis DSM 17244 TaxID=445971 RepID=B1CA91_9FIRM|nr:SdpI family protein [Anaerofustis stercorihominis]EDS72409.1 hypothetical protein ANASTE_02125 [Anaerofustis stercorihominis DSM 17244]MCQ4795447.1 SdpI family protein [Anaerofustis stercorihominis]
MKKINKELLLSTIACFIPMVIALLFYDKLPEQVPTHFGANGEANGYSSKVFFTFVMPLLYVGLHLFVNIMINNDPKRANSPKIMFSIVRWLIPVLMTIVTGLSIAAALNVNINVSTWVLCFVGILFIVIGNYLPKCKQNYTIGIKLPWTLNSEENWNKTHRLGGIVFVLFGLIQIAGAFFDFGGIITMITIFAVLLIPMIYSFILYKKGI